MKKTLVSAFGFIILMLSTIAWAAPVPDTGQTKCYDVAGAEITCPSPGQPLYGQDANYGINPMSYTKLDGSGNALPDSATSWVMVKDNVTGLIWEMKTNKDGVVNYDDPHDADNTYTWYDSNMATNGGVTGTPGICTNTEAFIKALNDANYGGYSDWRLPTIKELACIVDHSIPVPPTINTTHFPNTVSSFYWSSTTNAFFTYDAWGVHFLYGLDHYPDKTIGGYVRAVRGGEYGSLGNLVIGSFDPLDSEYAAGSYTDNRDGTVTDTSTSLMWQQDGSTSKSWSEALAYCEALNLGGYKDWRLPNEKELRSLVDYSRYSPAINTTYFPNTVSSSYWSSTTYAYTTSNAWGVYFLYGDDYYSYKSNSCYVRAVRGEQSVSFGNLVISPLSQMVTKDAGSTAFSVSNTGTGTMPWTASVISGSDWLSITLGNSGSNSGTITCGFTANTATTSRTATIRVTATGATGSPTDVTVTQASNTTACTAMLDGNLMLHIPYLSYVNPTSGTQFLWADLVYEPNPAYPTWIPLKMTQYDIIQSSIFSCAASTLSDDFKIHIHDLLFQDGITRMWVDMEYSSVLSVNGNHYWLVTNHGAFSN
jgi:hypothetical protein